MQQNMTFGHEKSAEFVGKDKSSLFRKDVLYLLHCRFQERLKEVAHTGGQKSYRDGGFSQQYRKLFIKNWDVRLSEVHGKRTKQNLGDVYQKRLLICSFTF